MWAGQKRKVYVGFGWLAEVLLGEVVVGGGGGGENDCADKSSLDLACCYASAVLSCPIQFSFSKPSVEPLWFVSRLLTYRD